MSDYRKITHVLPSGLEVDVYWVNKDIPELDMIVWIPGLNFYFKVIEVSEDKSTIYLETLD